MKRLNRKLNGILSPSILAADFSKLAEEIASVEEAGVDWLHMDVMDGHFVPNLTIGPQVVKNLRPLTKLPLDCHLMVSDPEKWISPFAEAGANMITIHSEAAGDQVTSILKQIREKGCHPGLSLNPSTPIETIAPYLDEVDLVLVMSVNPGFTGQKFLESTYAKIKKLDQMRAAKPFLIEVDGGVGKTNIAQLKEAGADAFVAGAAIFFPQDRKTSVQELRKLIQS